MIYSLQLSNAVMRHSEVRINKWTVKQIAIHVDLNTFVYLSDFGSLGNQALLKE